MGRKLFISLSVLPVLLICYLINAGCKPENKSVISEKVAEKEAIAQTILQHNFPDIVGDISSGMEQDRPTMEELEKERRWQDEVIKMKETEARLRNTNRYLLGTAILLALVILALMVSSLSKRKTMYDEQMEKIALLRMQNLRNRMSPHFFFNALSLLSNAVDNPERIRTNLASLSLLLRKSIENIDRIAVPIKNELDVVKAFIDLQRQIIPGPFDFDIHIEEGTDMQWLILAMMIQIPVENAVKHGLMPLAGEKKLSISIAEEEKDLIITIRDNGIGLTASGGRSTGTGTGLNTLFQTISLLNHRNKNKIKFTIGENTQCNDENKGVTVRISVPDKFSFNGEYSTKI
ncbi:MAG: sensor histidine kinase [Mangrovibacterium sp.]